MRRVDIACNRNCALRAGLYWAVDEALVPITRRSSLGGIVVNGAPAFAVTTRSTVVPTSTSMLSPRGPACPEGSRKTNGWSCCSIDASSQPPNLTTTCGPMTRRLRWRWAFSQHVWLNAGGRRFWGRRSRVLEGACTKIGCGRVRILDEERARNTRCLYICKLRLDGQAAHCVVAQ